MQKLDTVSRLHHWSLGPAIVHDARRVFDYLLAPLARDRTSKVACVAVLRNNRDRETHANSDGETRATLMKCAFLYVLFSPDRSAWQRLGDFLRSCAAAVFRSETDK
jgi:hypothetical protein